MGVKLADAVVYFKGDLTQLNNAEDRAEGNTRSFVGQAAGLIGTGLAAAAATAATAIAGIGAAGLKAALDASAVENTRNTFERLAESVGGDAVTAMEDMREATRGMVSDADLMFNANKFLNMGLAGTTEEAALMAEVATQLGMAMGEDASSSMENFAAMLAGRSIERLDSFGISSGVVQTRVQELMDTVDGMTSDKAFSMAVMEQAAVTMERVGEQGDTTAGGMARLKAQFENIKLAIGSALLPILNQLIQPISDLAVQYGPMLITWAQNAATWLGANLPVAAAALQQALQPVVDWVMANWPLIIATFQRFADIWTTKILPVIQAVWPVIQAIFQNAVAIIGALFKAWMQAFTGDWEGAWETIKTAFSGAWENMKEIYNQIIDQIAERLAEWLEDILGKINAKVESLKQAGANLIEGVKAGMANKFRDILSWIERKAKELAERFREALRIDSPSKVFMGFGENIDEGLIQGLESGERKIRSAMDVVIGAVTPPATAPAAASMSARSARSMRPPKPATSEIHLHIGTLVADERGLMELERKLYPLRLMESRRMGVTS